MLPLSHIKELSKDRQIEILCKQVQANQEAIKIIGETFLEFGDRYFTDVDIMARVKEIDKNYHP